MDGLLEKLKLAAPDRRRYTLESMVTHLYEARQYARLRRLFTNDEWMHARVEGSEYQYDGYVSDIAVAWEQVAHPLVLQQTERQEEPAALVECMHYALIRTGANTLAKSYDPDYIVKAVEDEVWTAQRALSVAARVPDAGGKLEIYTRVLLTDQLTPRQRNETEDHALDAAKRITSDSARYSAWQSLVGCLPSTKIPRAFELCRAIESKTYRALAMVEMAEHLSADRLAYALEITLDALQAESLETQAPHPAIAVDIHGGLTEMPVREEDRIRHSKGWRHSFESRAFRDLAAGLAAMAEFLTCGQLTRAFDSVLEIECQEHRAYVFAQIAPYLDSTLLRGALDDLLAMSDGPDRIEALAAIAQQLDGQQRGDLIEWTTKVALRVHDEVERAEVLASVSKHLEKSQLERVVRAAISLQQGRARALALAGMVAYLPDELLSPVLDSILAIDDEELCYDALEPAMGRLTGDLLARALDATSRFRDHWLRAHALVNLVGRVDEPSRARVLAQILDAALEIEDPYLRGSLLRDTVQYLEGDLLGRALDAAQEIEYGPEREPTLRMLSERLPEYRKAGVVERVTGERVPAWPYSVSGGVLVDPETAVPDREGTPPALDCSFSCLHALMSLSKYLDPAQRAEAITLARDVAMANEGLPRAKMLSDLAKELEGQEKAAVLSSALHAALHPEQGNTDSGLDQEWRADILSELGAQLEGDWLARALDGVLAIDELYRDRALAGMASKLDGDLLRQALESALAMEYDFGRARILVTLSEQLTGNLLARATEAALALPHTQSRVQALAASAKRVGGRRRARLLLDALMVAMTLPEESNLWSPRASALVDLSESMTILKKHVLAQALDSCLKMSDAWNRGVLLIKLAGLLDGHARDHALTEAVETYWQLESAQQRAEMLADLIPVTTAERKRELLLHALVTAQDVEGTDRVEFLINLAPYVVDAERDEILRWAVETAQAIDSAWDRAQALLSCYSVTVDSTLIGPIQQAIAEHLLVIRDQEQGDVFALCADSQLFAPPILSQPILAATVKSIVQLARWQWK